MSAIIRTSWSSSNDFTLVNYSINVVWIFIVSAARILLSGMQYLEFHRLINMELFFVCYCVFVLSSKLLNTETTEESCETSFNTKITRVINNLHSYFRRVGIDIF